MRRAKHTSERVDLIWFSEIQWDFLCTRKQRLLARFPEQWRILFVEPFTLGRKQHWLPAKRGRVTVVTVPFLKNIPSRMVQLFDNSLVRSFVTVAGRALAVFWCRKLGFSSSDRIIGLSNIYWGRVAASMPCRVRFYDANDDHLAFTAPAPWLRDSMRRYVQACDLIFYVSGRLLEKLSLRPEQRSVEIGNGVEYDHFATPRTVAPRLLAGLPRPVLGYAGTVDWVDTDLLASVAGAWPEYSVVLVGPAYDHDWAERHASLLELPNVHWVGKVVYEELPAWIQRFDLALMPFVRDELILAANPNKLYEYTAAGVPVLSVDCCTAVREARHVVHVAPDSGAFVRMVPEALADKRKAERQAFARAHNWDILAAAMTNELNAAREGRGM